MTSPSPRTAAPGDWIGRELGSRTVDWDEGDAILFALAVGARADELDLVYERRLRVLPTFGLTLAQWAPDVLGAAGAFPVGTALHGSQSLEVHRPLPRAGAVTMRARVADVWDKGSASIFDVAVDCEYFTAVWSIFAPGCGGFGGQRGPSAAPVADLRPATTYATAENSAALYRLCGDRHAIHIDPEAAAAIGQPRPILHGLATLSGSALALARHHRVHPAALTSLSGRFRSVVLPGDELAISVSATTAGGFNVTGPHGVVIDNAIADFGH